MTLSVRPRRVVVAAVVAAMVAGGLGALATGAAGARARPTIVLSQPLPSVVRQGDQVTVTGRVRGAIIVSRPCYGACFVVVRLESRPMYGTRRKSWTILARSFLMGLRSRFVLTWRVPEKLAPGPWSLRVALVYPPAAPARRVLAATRPTQAFVGPAPVPCAPPVPPAQNIPPGDGWIVGGLYIEGGPAPGLDECYSASYTVTATGPSGAVAASQQVAGGHSYTLVLPAGTYTLKAGCSVPAQATVTAGRQTTANTACLVP